MNAKKIAALLAPIALFAGACAEPVTVTNDKPVSVSPSSDWEDETPAMESTTATPEPDITPVTESEDIAGGSYVSGDEPSEMLTLDDAALATFDQVGVSCPDEDTCLNAVAAACMFLGMGYTSDDVYAEVAMFPSEQIFDGMPNSAIPHIFGVAKGGYCY